MASKTESLFTRNGGYICLDAYPELVLGKDDGLAPEILFGTRTATYIGLIIHYRSTDNSYIIMHRLNMPSHLRYSDEYKRILARGINSRELSFSNIYSYVYYNTKGTKTQGMVTQLQQLAEALAW